LHSEFRVGIGHAIPCAMAMESEPLDSSKTLAAADSAPDLGVPGRKPSEHVLRHEMLAAMVEGAREGLCIMDPRSVLLHSNQVAGELLGFGPKEAAGRPVRDLGEERDFDWSLVGDVVTGRVAVSTIQTLRTGRKLLVSGVPIWSDDGELSFIVVTIREITGMGQVMSRLRDAVELVEQSRSTLAIIPARELQLDDIVAQSPTLAEVRGTALQYAAVDSTILLLGETGAGKGMFSRLIHQTSPRAAGPFLEVNCGAIPEGLMEAELFGYAKGAFTGADPRGKIGLVELAHKGTLLLNEIGDLPLGLQVKLLRFLEDGEVWAVGAVKPKRPDVRIIASTNRDLPGMIAAGTFRGDLFYRLNVLCLEIPPLRKHAEDIPGLVELTLSRLERRLKRRRTITPAALRRLSLHPFPGNVRELLNLVERLMVTSTRDPIDIGDLPEALLSGLDETPGSLPDSVPTLRKALQKVESQILRDALARYKTQALAAKHLGITQSTVARKAKRYGLESRVS
jgi:PAS domain S-box-containing protein